MRRWFLVLGVGIAVAVIGNLYLFRSIAIDNPALGIIYHQYRWGAPYSIAADTNRDGRIDFKAISLGSDGFASDLPEFFEDRDYDGCFEMHAFHEHRIITRLELDVNCDGVYERILEGEEAKTFYASLPPPPGGHKSRPVNL